MHTFVKNFWDFFFSGKKMFAFREAQNDKSAGRASAERPDWTLAAERSHEFSQSIEMRKVKDEYKDVISDREKFYQKDLEGKPELEGYKKALDKHNDIVLFYSEELIKGEENLTPEEEAAIVIGTLLHDAGKGRPDFLADHHERGEKYAEEILEQYLKDNKSFGGIQLTQEIIDMALQGIKRHMNHPYLVNIVNKGETYPLPETTVDKVIYGADMLANTGFKNIAFRLGDEGNIATDKKVSEEKGITHLEAMAENVVDGVKNLQQDIKNLEEKTGQKMLTEGAEKMFDKHVGNISAIFEKMKEKNIFETIHGELEEVLGTAEVRRESSAYIMKRLNQEIINAGKEINREKLEASGREEELQEAIKNKDLEKMKKIEEELGLISSIDLQHYQM